MLTEIFRLLARHRTVIRLFDACAKDRPEIAEVWYATGRRGALAGLAAYLDDRTERGWLRRFPDSAAANRLVLETLTFWAVHRHWDPSPDPFDPQRVERTAISFLVAALVKSG